MRIQWEASQGRAEWPPLTPLQARMLEIAAFAEKGFLPRAGGLNDQAPLVVASIGAVMAEHGALARAQQRKAEEEAQNRGNR